MRICFSICLINMSFTGILNGNMFNKMRRFVTESYVRVYNTTEV